MNQKLRHLHLQHAHLSNTVQNQAPSSHFIIWNHKIHVTNLFMVKYCNTFHYDNNMITMSHSPLTNNVPTACALWLGKVIERCASSPRSESSISTSENIYHLYMSIHVYTEYVYPSIKKQKQKTSIAIVTISCYLYICNCIYICVYIIYIYIVYSVCIYIVYSLHDFACINVSMLISKAPSTTSSPLSSLGSGSRKSPLGQMD